jgi:hypothetical protein
MYDIVNIDQLHDFYFTMWVQDMITSSNEAFGKLPSPLAVPATAVADAVALLLPLLLPLLRSLEQKINWRSSSPYMHTHRISVILSAYFDNKLSDVLKLCASNQQLQFSSKLFASMCTFCAQTSIAQLHWLAWAAITTAACHAMRQHC